MNREIENYLCEVLEHIDSKKVKKAVEMELRYHLQETKEYWIEKGYSNQEAEEKAVDQMGSPIKLGHELSSVHRFKVNLSFRPIILHCLICLAVIVIDAFNSFFGEWMKFDTFRTFLYLMESIIILWLYFPIGKRILKHTSMRSLKNTTILFFSINLLLGITGYLLINFGSGIMAENGQAPLLLIMFLNFNWYFILVHSFVSVPEVVTILAICFGSPFLLYLSGLKESRIRNKQKL
jgi:hypothetical protein